LKPADPGFGYGSLNQAVEPRRSAFRHPAGRTGAHAINSSARATRLAGRSMPAAAAEAKLITRLKRGG
jgi:hypothetical protein